MKKRLYKFMVIDKLYLMAFKLPVCCNLKLQRHLGIQEILVLTQVQCNFLFGGLQFQLQGLDPGLCVNNPQFMLSVCVHAVRHAEHSFTALHCAGGIPENAAAPQLTR